MVTCQQCKGLGYQTQHEPKAIGRASDGEMVYSRFTVPINRRCETCSGRGKVEGEAAVQNLNNSPASHLETVSSEPVVSGKAA